MDGEIGAGAFNFEVFLVPVFTGEDAVGFVFCVRFERICDLAVGDVPEGCPVVVVEEEVSSGVSVDYEADVVDVYPGWVVELDVNIYYFLNWVPTIDCD